MFFMVIGVAIIDAHHRCHRSATFIDVEQNCTAGSMVAGMNITVVHEQDTDVHQQNTDQQ